MVLKTAAIQHHQDALDNPSDISPSCLMSFNLHRLVLTFPISLLLPS